MQDIETIRKSEAAREAASAELIPELQRLRDELLKLNPEWECQLKPTFDGKGLYLNCNDNQLIECQCHSGTVFYKIRGTNGCRFDWSFRTYSYEECLKTAIYIMRLTREDIDRIYGQIASQIGLC